MNISQIKTRGGANVGLIIGVIVVIAILTFIFTQSKTDESATTTSGNADRTAVTDSDNADVVVDAEMTADIEEAQMMDEDGDPEDEMKDKPGAEASATSNGTYTDYDPALLANAENGDVLIFFHAGWCPSCVGLDKDIKKQMDNIPSGVTILQVNYDTETELKKKYGVTRQHTLVRVDSEGNKIETLTGLTNTLDQVVAQL